ncbi:MAG: hypothetical protein ACREOX_10055, partial [Stenotrophomonas sp.]
MVPKQLPMAVIGTCTHGPESKPALIEVRAPPASAPLSAVDWDATLPLQPAAFGGGTADVATRAAAICGLT